MHKTLPVLFFCLLIIMTGCQEEQPPTITIPPQPANGSLKTDSMNSVKAEETDNQIQEDETDDELREEEQDISEKQPPTPPIKEDFQGAPQLSLFPRVGDFQPPPDSERHPYWRTFIDHLVKVTGVAENAADGSRGWVFRSINSIDSLGYFSPLKVKPDTVYQVSFNLMGDLPEGASAGIGILEFDEFLWIGEQYTEETFKKHYRGVHEGRRVTGKPVGLQTFTFRTSPETHMVHVVLFREGTHDRNSLMFDNISIK